MSRLCEDLEKYDYSPVMGEPENGFYPVPKGRGTYYWNGERIVPKPAKTSCLGSCMRDSSKKTGCMCR